MQDWVTYSQIAGYKTDEEFVGVIAQDMQKVAPYMVNKEGEFLSYNSTALVYMLVNAFKEEHAKRKELEERMAHLESLLGIEDDQGETGEFNQTSEEATQEVTLSNQGVEEPLLYQNQPNPFKGSTEIGYYLPKTANNAMIIITEVETGKVIKRVDLNGTGSGKLTVNVENLSAGAYSYTLLVDGKQSLSRQMMLQR